MTDKTKLPTLKQFQERFPDDNSCLDHIMRTRYGNRFECAKCNKQAKYYRVKRRRAYECEHCGNQVYPTAGTPFENTRTPLTDWFMVMFMFSVSRNGVSAKEVERTIGVTYKTAWRMCNRIRQYMGYVDGDAPLGGAGGGIVEADEAFIGGRDKQGQDDKAVVLGISERGGDVITRVIPSRRTGDVLQPMTQWIRKGSRVATDEAKVYKDLPMYGYKHGTVNHSQKQWVAGDIHTNNIEAFWGSVKRGIEGTYISVSKKWLQTYLWEFEYRQNLRKEPHLMLELLLQAFPRPAVALTPLQKEADQNVG